MFSIADLIIGNFMLRLRSRGRGSTDKKSVFVAFSVDYFIIVHRPIIGNRL